MNCPYCNAENDNDNLFCVSCGKNFSQSAPESATATQPSPTQYYNADDSQRRDDNTESVQTVLSPTQNFNTAPQNFNPSIPYIETPQRKSSNAKFIWLGLLIAFLLIGGAVGAYFLLNNPPPAAAEVLPDHLGLFLYDKDLKNLTELSKQDSTNAVQIKDDLLKNESLPAADEKPNLILYSDGKDIPLGDLKLVQLDTIKDDGTLKQINFQAAPVEGKTEMKRLRVPDGLANGKYALALFDGFLDEGKHKFWAFQVKNAPKTDNGDLAKALTLALKPKNAPPSNTNQNFPSQTTANTVVKPAPTPKTEPSVPAGSRVAYCASSNVIVRGSPSLNGRKVNALRRGQKIYVLNYSDNYDSWNGMEGNWAYVQTESGGRGWVFSPLINY